MTTHFCLIRVFGGRNVVGLVPFALVQRSGITGCLKALAYRPATVPCLAGIYKSWLVYDGDTD
ncbi:MAG: hypothetical protein IKD58_01560 [Loktanella sp.]|nr:hypothetical protein [Loktanella sp.]